MNWLNFENTVLIASMAILSISIIAIFLRAVIGPTVTDRIICINMIGTKIIIFICMVAALLRESYLIDVAIVYALINFISMVVLTYAYGYAYNKKMLSKGKKGGRR
ncbi:MAG: sodium:proton antiporter [Lachnospiraceae bacterium]|nr:sodium:proton antiporter [Lachnospiraceae bacterium]